MSNPSHLIIVGAGGFGLDVAVYAEDIIRLRNVDFAIAGFLDDAVPRGTVHGGYPVLGDTEGELDTGVLYAVALGQPAARRAMVEKLRARGAKFATLMHPAAYIASNAVIGLGSIIAPFSFVGAQAILGAHVVLNVHATVAHEAQVGDCSVIGEQATVQGRAALDANVLLGARALVLRGQQVSTNSDIAPGAVVGA